MRRYYPVTETKKTETNIKPESPKSRRNVGSLVMLIVFALIIGGLHLRFAWNKYDEAAESEAILLVKSVESLLHKEHISQLSGTENDEEKSDYLLTKKSLSGLVQTVDRIHFAYLLAEHDGKMIFLVDSEPPDSPDYSPPGQVYEEAGYYDWIPFKSGKTIITPPTTDRWGTWISALVPIKNLEDGKVIAVLGIDFSASEWYKALWEKMVPDIIIIISLFILFIVLLSFWDQNLTLKKLSKKLAFSEAIYRSVFEQAPIGIAIGENNRYVSSNEYGKMNANPMFENITGRKSEDLFNIEWMDITHPDDLKNNIDLFKQFKSGNISGYSLEKRFIKPDGTTVWTNMKVSSLLGGTEMRTFYLCLLEDISIRKAAEESLKESERSKSVLLSHLPGLAYRCNYDREWTMQFVSDGCMELTGYPPQSLLYNMEISYNDVIAPEYRDHLWKEWERILPKRLPLNYEYEIITADGSRKWVLELAEGVFNEQNEVEALEGIVIDISDRKKTENSLRYSSEHDSMTGLHNRKYLEEFLLREENDCPDTKKALMSINLSAAQSLTMTFGFHYTQEVIKKTVRVLEGFCNDKTQLFNTHENRFVFYVKDYKDKNELLAFCESIADTLESIMAAERISGGIGVTEIELFENEDPDQILKKLLIASEKSAGISDKYFNICFYDSEMENEIEREQNIKTELSKIAADWDDSTFFLQYQPILDLRTNRIRGFEALSRLNSSSLGMVPPLEFIPIAEKTKLIIPIGYNIFHKSFNFLKELEANGYGSVSVSVNVSAIQLLSVNFASNLLKMIKKEGINPENISIEITESVFSSNYEEINNILGDLKKVGLNIAIDDFGTGYSSLAREQELNVDCLKIDKYFIDKLLEVNHENALSADIISMAHKMGHYVIAEGVEEEIQKNHLIKMGCDNIQGYLVAKPLDRNAAIEMLKSEAAGMNDK